MPPAPKVSNGFSNADHCPSSTPFVDETACHRVAHQWSPPPLQAIVGANAFQHASGVHQDGMLKNKQTYEIMSPEYIGLVRGEEFGITLGKLSGKAAVMSRLKTLGYDDLTKEQSDDVFRRFKVGQEGANVGCWSHPLCTG